MNAQDLKKKLQSIIESKLLPLIDNDYVYWDLPYHINIGDTLIWQGTLDFLSKNSYKMLDYGSVTTVNMNNLKEDTIILLHGGGNFGDIYSIHQQFRISVVENFPNNKIIILPQTIYFKDKLREEKDLELFSQHENLYLCVRDSLSYEIACKYLDSNRVLLLPDMAFCIKSKILKKNVILKNKSLLMNRIDVEATYVNKKNIEKIDVESDWPTFEKFPLYFNYLRFLMAINRRLPNSQKIILNKYINFYAMSYVRKKLIDTGVQFINDFDTVYTTRLHGCILSLLLDKQIILLDNSYGKNKGYYEAWLKESENIKVILC